MSGCKALSKSTRFSSAARNRASVGAGRKARYWWWSQPTGGQGIGRIRLTRVVDASARSLEPAITAAIEVGSQVRTDDWRGYSGLDRLGYRRQILRSSAEVGGNLLPLTNRVASLLKRWLLGTHQGAVSAEHLDYYLDEYTFRFNRRTSGSRGLLFLRLMQQAVDLSPVPAKDILGGRRPAKINRLIELESSA